MPAQKCCSSGGLTKVFPGGCLRDWWDEFCCTARCRGLGDAPVVAEGDVADIFEEHLLSVDLPAVVAHVAVGVGAVWQAISNRVVADLAQHICPSSCKSTSSPNKHDHT